MSSLKTGILSASVDADGNLTLINTRTNRLLLRSVSPYFLRPSLDGSPVEIHLTDIKSEGDKITLSYEGAAVDDFVVEIQAIPGEEALDFKGTFRSVTESQINALEIFASGTQVNFNEAINFRNRHYTHRTWPELILGGKGFETNTYSTDWQFAPHPSAILFKADKEGLFLGTLDLPRSFGLYLSIADYRVKHCYLDYGTLPNGQKLVAGEEFQSPTIRVFYRDDIGEYEAYTDFGRMLVENGKIPNPAKKKREGWWTEPLYCTWIDQCFGSHTKMLDDLQAQASSEELISAVSFVNEKLIHRAVAEIEKEGYPIRTILLDDGWQISRGQWEPHPKRFPDLRKLVDELHSKGYKVVVWWNWAEIMPDAQVDPSHLMAGGQLNRHNARVRDYSSPLTQEEYLKPLFHKLFSSDPECYNLDGVKTDFLADKVHPDMPLHDASWRGEENYFFHVTRLFYTELKKHKPDGIHIGCAGNYWLAEYVDINRTYDVSSSDWREHEERARMLMATTPGCPVAYDFHNHLEKMDGWFESAKQLGASVEIGNVLWFKRDRFSEAEHTSADYRAVLHQGLKK